MKIARLISGLTVFLVGVLLAPVLCHADPAVPVTFPAEAAYSQATPHSAISYLPFVALPGRFLFSGGYTVHLNLTEMRIDHIATDSRCTPHNRTFMISAGFAQPVGQLFSSRFELPLFSADRFSMYRLAPASVGDYVVHLSNSPLYSSAASLIITARF